MSEMSENISLKMDAKFAVSLKINHSIGKNLCLVLYVITYISGENDLMFVDCSSND